MLLATACGDALGVPYEFSTPPGPDEQAEMLGGGLGDFAPGEWSDDTSMGVVVAEAAAGGGDLTTDAVLDEVVRGFVRWYDAGPPDIGIQTRAVLGSVSARLQAGETGPARIAREAAASYAARQPRSAGNGALMRTAAVPLAHLHDRGQGARAARMVAELTHADPLAGDSCVLWSETIRVAVLTGQVELTTGLDLLPEEHRDRWRDWLDEVLERDISTWTPNGFTVTALQAAAAAVVRTPVPDDGRHLEAALHVAVRIGDDTDTVAAIAGGLLGGRWGASVVPATWRIAVHGWPGRNGEDLVAVAYAITTS